MLEIRVNFASEKKIILFLLFSEISLNKPKLETKLCALLLLNEEVLFEKSYKHNPFVAGYFTKRLI